jgi:hypothetical protein
VCSCALTAAGFWAEVSRAAQAPEPHHDVYLMMPDVDQAAMQILCENYAELGVEHGDALPDLRTVSVTFEFPPGATRLKVCAPLALLWHLM